jgi:hypothetical protein
MKEEEDKVDDTWVAELEEAQEELREILKSPSGTRSRRGNALKACSMLRQWKKLDASTKKGLKV